MLSQSSPDKSFPISLFLLHLSLVPQLNIISKTAFLLRRSRIDSHNPYEKLKRHGCVYIGMTQVQASLLPA